VFEAKRLAQIRAGMTNLGEDIDDDDDVSDEADVDEYLLKGRPKPKVSRGLLWLQCVACVGCFGWIVLCPRRLQGQQSVAAATAVCVASRPSVGPSVGYAPFARTSREV
jgi:hypothetical protein